MKKDIINTDIFKLNEATSIAVHAATYMALNMDRFVGATEISESLKASRDHVEKVMQRMAKAGFITAKRGPKGGFKLKKNPDEITLLEPFEVFEGEVTKDIHCPLGQSFCGGKLCVIGKLFSKLQHEAVQFLSKITLADVVNGNF